MQPRDYGRWAEHLVNTATGAAPPLDTVADLRAFLASVDQPAGRLTAADVVAVHALRQDLTGVFAAGTPESRVALVRNTVGALDVRFEVTEHDGTPHLHLARGSDDV